MGFMEAIGQMIQQSMEQKKKQRMEEAARRQNQPRLSSNPTFTEVIRGLLGAGGGR